MNPLAKRPMRAGGSVDYGIGGALLKLGSNLAAGKGFGSGALKGVGKAAVTPGSGIGAGTSLAGNLLQKSKNPLLQGIGKAAGVASNFMPGGGGVGGAIGALAGGGGQGGGGGFLQNMASNIHQGGGLFSKAGEMASNLGQGGGGGLLNMAQGFLGAEQGVMVPRRMQGVKLMKRPMAAGGMVYGDGGMIYADNGVATPTDPKKKESADADVEPLNIPLNFETVGGRRGAEELGGDDLLDFRGFTTAVDNTAIPMNFVVPDLGEPIEVKEEEKEKEEEKDPVIKGCMDPSAENYNPAATEDDGSCTYPPKPIDTPEPDPVEYKPADVPNVGVEQGLLRDISRQGWNNPGNPWYSPAKFKGIRTLMNAPSGGGTQDLLVRDQSIEDLPDDIKNDPTFKELLDTVNVAAARQDRNQPGRAGTAISKLKDEDAAAAKKVIEDIMTGKISLQEYKQSQGGPLGEYQPDTTIEDLSPSKGAATERYNPGTVNMLLDYFAGEGANSFDGRQSRNKTGRGYSRRLQYFPSEDGESFDNLTRGGVGGMGVLGMQPSNYTDLMFDRQSYGGGVPRVKLRKRGR